MFPAINSAKLDQLHFITACNFWVDCVHDFIGSKYLILLGNLFSRDVNLVLLAAFQNLKKMLKPEEDVDLFIFTGNTFALVDLKYGS